MEETVNTPETKPKRPQLLTILCIITFISSGMGVLGFLVASMDYESTMEVMRTLYGDMPEASFLINAPRNFFIISFILSVASVMGAVLMWNLHKPGFHLYTSAQIITLILPFIFFGGEVNQFFNIMLTALFVYLYARNLQFMH